MTHDLVAAPHHIARYILSTTDTSRRDRLWPAHMLVFETNPLSIAYGACGIALFLHEVNGGLPDPVRAWLLDRPIETRFYPPGLYLGTAGIAYAFDRLGFTERALEVMPLVYESPLRDSDASMVLGIAGWGWTSLHFWDRTGNSVFLEHAVDGGDQLLRSAEVEGDTLCWRHSGDGSIHFGYGYGAAGVALFLLELAKRTGEQRFGDAAHRALAHDIGKRVETETGVGWRRYADDTLIEPYWLHGNAGIGTTLLRFYEQTADPEIGALIRTAADSTCIQFSVLPGQWEGMAGIGEFLLDTARILDLPRYRDAAVQLAKTLLWYRVETDDGWAFPGASLARLSTDLATGSAGIGLFLHRLQSGGPRLLTDLEVEDNVLVSS